MEINQRFFFFLRTIGWILYCTRSSDITEGTGVAGKMASLMEESEENPTRGCGCGKYRLGPKQCK